MRAKPKTSISRKFVRTGGAIGFAVAALIACSFDLRPNDWDSHSLSVPFRQQDGFGLCAAACVQMWRLYCGWPDNITQAEMYQYMHGSAGVPAWEIPNGVNHFTCTSDAHLRMSPVDGLNLELAAQIASIDGGWPVIALVRGGFHAVLIDGGEAHSDASAHYWWDTLLIHDPQSFEGDWPVPAADWINPQYGNFVPNDTTNGTLQQVVKSGAVVHATYYLGLYGDGVSIWGDDECPECDPPDEDA